MPALPLLLDVADHRPCDWDLLLDAEGRAGWLGFFESHIDLLSEQAGASAYDRVAIDAARAEVLDAIRRLRADPHAFGDRLDILALDRIRDGALRRHGVPDPCRAIKARQNRMALEALPARLRAVDNIDGPARLIELLTGVLAGNLFDMGAAPTAREFASAPRLDFNALRRRVDARPWRIDDADAMRFGGHERVVIFVDNAGADCVLGMLPLAREFLRAGAEVILAANTGPTLNDVTAEELRGIVGEAVTADPTLQSERLRIVETGTSDPLLDLSDISQDLCDASAGADLLVLIGMGRAIESNWLAKFACECWRLAVLKDPKVARRREAALFDCVVRRTPPAR